MVLVKSGQRIDLEVVRVKRQGRDGSSGLNFLVTMDGSNVAQQAFDLACRFAGKHDTLYGLHVSDGSNSKLIDEFNRWKKCELECIRKQRHLELALGAVYSVIKFVQCAHVVGVRFACTAGHKWHASYLR